MSNMPEIKERANRLKGLAQSTKERLTGPGGPTSDEMKKKLKDAGTRMGIGSGISLFGLVIMCVAAIYVIAVVILLVNIALELWLSALIVVGGFILLGILLIAIGAGIVRPAAKELSAASGQVTWQLKEAGEEAKVEVEKLQEVAKKEAEERQKQFAEMLEQAKKAAPAAGGALVMLCLLRRAMKTRKQKRILRKVIEQYEEAKAED